MKQFLSVNDVPDVKGLIDLSIEMKKSPFAFKTLGEGKTIGLLFFNPSLRTRLSTVKAANNLGLEVMTMNVTQDSWQLETEDGVIMDGAKAEHVREAAAVIGQYCDLIAVRSFPELINREEDYKDKIIKAFAQYSGRPVLNLESATLHPLQSLADLVTIEEHKKIAKPKVVLSWAPHVKALPQAVANSFVQWVHRTDYELVITAPKGFELSPEFTGSATTLSDQKEAMKGADFVYVKNWSSYNDYGKVGDFRDWIIDQEKMNVTNEARFMHCLPVRRNVIVSDEVLDGPGAIHIQQANNRTWAAQAVLKAILNQL